MGLGLGLALGLGFLPSELTLSVVHLLAAVLARVAQHAEQVVTQRRVLDGRVARMLPRRVRVHRMLRVALGWREGLRLPTR